MGCWVYGSLSQTRSLPLSRSPPEGIYKVSLHNVQISAQYLPGRFAELCDAISLTIRDQLVFKASHLCKMF